MGNATRSQYADMRRMCGASSDINVSDKMAVRIMHRLCKKYGMRDTPIKFRGHRGSGMSYGGKVSMSHNPSVYLIIHEFAHEAQKRSSFFRDKLANVKNVGTDHHGLHYEIVLNKVNQFCKASNYFEKMRNRTRKPKAVVGDSSLVSPKTPEAPKMECITPEVPIAQ